MINEKTAKSYQLRRPKFYSSLIVYWFIVPGIFMMYLLMRTFMEGISFQQLLATNLSLTVMLLIALLTPFAGYFLLRIPKQDRQKRSQAGLFLKLMLFQQLIVGNLPGAILVYLSFRELSTANSGMLNKWKRASLYTLVGIQYTLSFIAIYALMIAVKKSG